MISSSGASSSGPSGEVEVGGSPALSPGDAGQDRATDRQDRPERSVHKFPAVKFLTRPDFFPMLQANEVSICECVCV